MIDDGAFGALAALAIRGARIDALIVDACLTSATAQVVATADLTQTIFANLSVAARGVAVANRFTCAAHTFLVGQTVLVAAANRLAQTAIACVIRWAFVGNGARRRWIFAADVRIADQIVGTDAGLDVILNEAFGVCAARSWTEARIDALLIYAGQITATV